MSNIIVNKNETDFQLPSSPELCADIQILTCICPHPVVKVAAICAFRHSNCHVNSITDIFDALQCQGTTHHSLHQQNSHTWLTNIYLLRLF